jgi:hypothetical protein
MAPQRSVDLNDSSTFVSIFIKWTFYANCVYLALRPFALVESYFDLMSLPSIAVRMAYTGLL